MAELVYSAGLTSKLFWLQESRKTAGYILDGYSKADIRKIAWEENIYQVKAEYRAYEVLNGTYRRVFALPEAVLRAFTTCDVETAKILNLIAILMDSRLFFEFLHEVYDEKLRLGEKEITDRDLNVFFSDKALQSDVVAGWTDTAVRKLKQCFTRMMFEAGLLESSAKPRTIKLIHIDYRTEELLTANGIILESCERSLSMAKLSLDDRLNQIEDKISEKSFRENKGLGNEVGYYIFDYDPREELYVRNHIAYLKDRINNGNKDFRIVEFDLFHLMVEILQEEGYLEAFFDLEKENGFFEMADSLVETLGLDETNELNLIISRILQEDLTDSVVFLTGVGKCHPIIASHNILNNLHQVLDSVPVVLFYPGEYSGQDLKLFGTMDSHNYYRAFRLV